MAEELLVKEMLSQEMIASGRALVERLDRLGWRPSSAFWLFDSEQNRWKLIMSSPEVEKHGPRPAYESASRVLSSEPLPGLSLTDLSIVPSRNEIVKLMAMAIGTGPGIQGVRFSRNTINGHYIPDAYIYRSNKVVP